MTAPVLLVLGAGPGLGAAVAARFAREGYAVELAVRTPEDAEELVASFTRTSPSADVTGLAVDLTDPADVTRTVTGVGERHGRIDVLHFNPSAFRMATPLTLTVAELFEDLALGVAPLLPAVQAALPFMSAGSRVLVTGSAAADTPWNEAASLGVQKAAVRNLVTSLDTTLTEHGVRAVAVQINGVLGREGTFSPPPIAEAMYAAVSRADDAWTPQVGYP